MKLFFTLALLFSAITITQAQTDSVRTKPKPNVMTLEVTSEWVSNNDVYRNGKFEPGAPTFSSGRNIYINNRYVAGVGRHYKNLKPYFEGCDAAMKQYNKAQRHLRFYQISLYTGMACGFGGILKVANPKDDKTDVTAIVIFSAGAGLLLNALIQDGLEKRAIKKSVKAYNKCQVQKL